MSTFTIDAARCDRSPGCPSRRLCPKGAIVPIPGGAYPGANGYTIIDDKCSGCGACMRVCAGGAIRIG